MRCFMINCRIMNGLSLQTHDQDQVSVKFYTKIQPNPMIRLFVCFDYSVVYGSNAMLRATLIAFVTAL